MQSRLATSAGVLRARYRKSVAKLELIEPGHRFAAGDHFLAFCGIAVPRIRGRITAIVGIAVGRLGAGGRVKGEAASACEIQRAQPSGSGGGPSGALVRLYAMIEDTGTETELRIC
jgi:hypothetical protein